jgi:hypothetical protein
LTSSRSKDDRSALTTPSEDAIAIKLSLHFSKISSSSAPGLSFVMSITKLCKVSSLSNPMNRSFGWIYCVIGTFD